MLIPEKFSVEELNLMCIFDTMHRQEGRTPKGRLLRSKSAERNREALRDELITALHDVYEPEMIELFGSTLEKLDTLTDEEFAAIAFYIADDFDEGDVFAE